MEDKSKLFDEFGNYYGEVDDSEESENSYEGSEEDGEQNDLYSKGIEKQDELEKGGQKTLTGDDLFEIEEETTQKVVLFEDKNYYPDLEEAYPEAEVMIEEEDLMDIDQPIIQAPEKQKYDYAKKTHLEGRHLFI